MSRRNLEEDFKECSKVFVYGSLKKGGWNNRFLSSSSKLRTTSTKDLFILGDVGFPYAVPQEVVPDKYPLDYRPVEGELWEMEDVFTFNTLDRLESEGLHYHRELREMEDGQQVWMYVQNDWETLYYCRPCSVTEKGHYKWLAEEWNNSK